MVSNLSRAVGLTRRVIRINNVPEVLEFKVTDPTHLEALPGQLGEYSNELHGIVHSIAYANPERALGGASSTRHGRTSGSPSTSPAACSYVSLTMARKPLANPRASIVSLTFDARVSGPKYYWMSMAKAGLESVPSQASRAGGHPLQSRRRRARRDHHETGDPRC